MIQGGELIAGLSHNGVLDGIQRLIVDPEQITMQEFAALKRVSPDTEYVMLRSPLREPIARKSPSEIDAITRAQRIAEGVFDEILGILRPGLSERDVGAEIVYRAVKAGASGVSFPPIVASGPQGALPHARPSDRVMNNGDIVVLDFGCVVDGYRSDMTRTVALGKTSDEARGVHGVVLEALQRAADAARAGMNSRDLDAAARQSIRKAGLAAAFVHSLGHGVGMEVHEWPRVSWNTDDILPSDCVITLEPGVYLNGEFGVRIEDMVVLREGGNEVITRTTRDLLVV
jgi:Xaa-Pro aminopeptidase